MRSPIFVGQASRLSPLFRKPVLVELLLWLTPLVLIAQNYSIDWYKIAGGGGTSTGGVYAVSGTIGQTDAGGPLTNGQYSVTGGFWVLPAAVAKHFSPFGLPSGDKPFAFSFWFPRSP